MARAVRSTATCLSILLLLAPFSGASAQEFMMPWEKMKQKEPIIDPNLREDMEVVVGTIEVIRLTQPGQAVILSHPEVADVYLQGANRLFIIGRNIGITEITVADKTLTPVWNSQLSVVVEKTH